MNEEKGENLGYGVNTSRSIPQAMRIHSFMRIHSYQGASHTDFFTRSILRPDNNKCKDLETEMNSRKRRKTKVATTEEARDGVGR